MKHRTLAKRKRRESIGMIGAGAYLEQYAEFKKHGPDPERYHMSGWYMDGFRRGYAEARKRLRALSKKEGQK